MSKPKPTARAVAGRTAIHKNATTEPKTVLPGETKPSNRASQQTPRASLHDPAESQHILESRNRKRKRGNTSTTSSNQAQAQGHSHSHSHGQNRPHTKRITLPPHPPRHGARRPPLPALPPSVLAVIATTTTTTAPSKTQMTGRDRTSANALQQQQQQQQRAAAAATRLQTLHAAATLLQSLHVRNRNQHRGQPWWKWFSMLRRTVAEVLRLEVQLWALRFGGEREMDGLDAGGSGSGGDGGGDGERGSGKRVKVGARRVKLAEQAEHRPLSQAEVMRKRLALEEKLVKEKTGLERWLREVVVPKAWVAFTALVGDGQFAGLGVVLIGLVGEVASLVGGCEEYGEGVGAGDDSEMKMVMMSDAVIRDDQPATARLQGNRSHGPRRALGHDSAMEDVGEPVQRRREVRTTITTTMTTTALDTTLQNPGTKQERELRDKDTEMQDDSADSPGHEPPRSSPFASFHDTLESDAELHNTSMQDEATSRPAAPAKDPRNEAAVSEAEGDDTDHSSHAVVQRKTKTKTKTREMKKNRIGTTTAHIQKRAVPQDFAQTNSSNNSQVKLQGKDVKPKAENEPEAEADTRAKAKAKAVTKTSKKKKKGNAIDDLFAGFA